MDEFTKELNKIQNAQIDARKMTLNPPWKRLTATEVAMKGLHYDYIIQDDVEQAEPLTKEQWRGWLKDFGKQEPKPFNFPKLPPYLMGINHAKGIEKMLMCGDYPGAILGQWTWFDVIRGFFYKITRRLKMTAKKEAKIRSIIREEIEKELEEHCELKHQETRNLYLTEIDFRGGITLNEFIDKLLDHLGIALKTTPQKIELVSMKKSKKKAKSKIHKPKK